MVSFVILIVYGLLPDLRGAFATLFFLRFWIWQRACRNGMGILEKGKSFEYGELGNL